jgi:hypothetical protein
MKDRSAMLDAALALAAKFGWKIFPARMENGRKWSWRSAQFDPNGQNWGMTNDPKQLAAYYKNRKWGHKAGIGIPTGTDNRIFIVETDTKEGHDVDGASSLKKLEAEHSPLPETLMAESPSGSLHRYFNNPPGVKVKNSASEIAPGVDVRGEGGMVVAPPSVRDDGVYKWLNEGTPIADAPEWLIELIKADDRPRKANGPLPKDLEHLGALGYSTDPTDYSSLIADDPAKVAAALATIPNPDLGWEEWNRIGMATWAATEGSDDGLKAFHSWSKKSQKYDENDTDIKWNGYSRLKSVPAHSFI